MVRGMLADAKETVQFLAILPERFLPAEFPLQDPPSPLARFLRLGLLVAGPIPRLFPFCLSVHTVRRPCSTLHPRIRLSPLTSS